MSRSEPSVLQLILDEVRMLKNDMRIEVGAVRADLKAISERTEAAHKRIDARENREKGILIGVSLGSGTIGAALAKYLPGLFS